MYSSRATDLMSSVNRSIRSGWLSHEYNTTANGRLQVILTLGDVDIMMECKSERRESAT